MKRALRFLVPSLGALALAACGPKPAGGGGASGNPVASNGGGNGGSRRGGQPAATPVQIATPTPPADVTRQSSSQNPQAVASFSEGVQMLQQIRKDGTGNYDTAIARLQGATSLDSSFAEAW